VDLGGPKEPCVRWESRSPCNEAILRKKGAARCTVYGHSAVRCAKTAEPIKMPYGIWTWLGPRKHVLDGGAHKHHLANTIEPYTCGGNTATSYCILFTRRWCRENATSFSRDVIDKEKIRAVGDCRVALCVDTVGW